MSEQLAFIFRELENGNGRLTTAQAGLRRECPPGASRLLAELVRRGLPEEDLRAAASIALMLDQGVNEHQ